VWQLGRDNRCLDVYLAILGRGPVTEPLFWVSFCGESRTCQKDDGVAEWVIRRPSRSPEAIAVGAHLSASRRLLGTAPFFARAFGSSPHFPCPRNPRAAE
jgi:hypothetical protein